MRNEIGEKEGPAYTGIVSAMIQPDELPLYEQAAQNTGFELSVSAREGEPYRFWYPGDREMRVVAEMRTVKMSKGKLGITISRPVEQTDHTAFWKEYRKLQAEQNPPK